jgi:autotransporter passenger strand-loop-strand repeat protein
MATYTVSAGVTSTSLTLSPGDTATVYGTASSFTLVSGGDEVVEQGGSTVSTTLSGILAFEIIHFGGMASDITNRGGVIEVEVGGTATSVTLSREGSDWVSGTASFTTVSNGGVEYVLASGTVISTMVDISGIQQVQGGTAIDTTVNGGGLLVDEASETELGTTISARVNSGAREQIERGGTASFTVVSSGGFEVVSDVSAVSTTISNGGTEIVFAGGTAIDTTVSGGGNLIVLPGGGQTGTMLSGGAIVSTGIVVYQPAPGLIVHAPVVSDSVVVSGGTEFVLSGGTAVSTTVNVGGAIDVAYLPYAPGGSATVDSATDELTVSVGGRSYMQKLAGDYATTAFLVEQDTNNATIIRTQFVAPCYRRGTRILTDRGEVAVEALRVGGLVHTVLGGTLLPIVWVGDRNVDCASHPKPGQVWPVRVATGAFGPGRPHRDLFLSPDHAVYVNEVLIPIRHLINGATIAQVKVARVTYHHIELAHHDILLAEGLPAESFLDMKDGSNYANRPGPVRLYPDHSACMWEAFACARLVVTGPELAAARAMVERFAPGQEAA